EQIRAATANHSDPLERLKVAVELLFESSRPDPAAKRPLFTDFAPSLLLTHPTEVRIAHAPLLTLLAELTEQAAEAGRLRTTANPRRVAAMIMQTVMFNAQSSPAAADPTINPLTADEIWDFCAHGFGRN
ncbi:MAG TPA: TetR/AcrR family transcriptional regulator, partial [Mycobacterium sp.]|nr:TetR/AcrR family transcriptional regulator [Mycobacterium sp.]